MSSSESSVPVLEVGGTHVTAALVDTAVWELPDPPVRLPLEASGPADVIVGAMLRAARTVDLGPGHTWGVAMPDPFDYPRGIALFQGVGKFESLYGRDLGAELGGALQGRLSFINDADAFILGEWAHGAARGVERCTGLTLGTGVGSGWLVDGQVTDPGVPSGGRAHHLVVDGAPLEDAMSRRAIRRAYAAATGDQNADVREIAERARSGDEPARVVLSRALRTLGAALGPAVTGFGAQLLVVGGSMAASWDLFEPWFQEGARARGGSTLPPTVVAADAEHAPLFGAAVAARRAEP